MISMNKRMDIPVRKTYRRQLLYEIVTKWQRKWASSQGVLEHEYRHPIPFNYRYSSVPGLHRPSLIKIHHHPNFKHSNHDELDAPLACESNSKSRVINPSIIITIIRSISLVLRRYEIFSSGEAIHRSTYQWYKPDICKYRSFINNKYNGRLGYSPIRIPTAFETL